MTERSVLFGFWHGLGDNVMAIPALREYRRRNPGVRVGWAVRHDIDVKGLMENCPYVDEVLPVYSNPHILPTGVRKLDGALYRVRIRKYKMKTALVAKKHGYDTFVNVTTRHPLHPDEREDILHYHKTFCIAAEMGVEPGDLSTEVFIDDDDRRRARKWLDGVPSPRVFVHREASIERKEISVDRTRELIDRYPGHEVIECASQPVIEGSRHLDLGDIRRNIGVIELCDRCVCLDSANMHFAGALKKEMTAVFTVFPIHLSAPLHYRYDIVCDDEAFVKAWERERKKIPGIRPESGGPKTKRRGKV